MPKIQITISYPVDLANYPGATTEAEALAQDVKSCEDGHIGLTELVEFASDATITVVE